MGIEIADSASGRSRRDLKRARKLFRMKEKAKKSSPAGDAADASNRLKTAVLLPICRRVRVRKPPGCRSSAPANVGRISPFTQNTTQHIRVTPCSGSRPARVVESVPDDAESAAARPSSAPERNGTPSARSEARTDLHLLSYSSLGPHGTDADSPSPPHTSL